MEIFDHAYDHHLDKINKGEFVQLACIEILLMRMYMYYFGSSKEEFNVCFPCNSKEWFKPDWGEIMAMFRKQIFAGKVFSTQHFTFDSKNSDSGLK